MNPLKPRKLLVFEFRAVFAAFEKHTGMSFHEWGCWNLDYSKTAGEPDFRYARYLRHEQDGVYFYRSGHDWHDLDTLDKVLAKSEKALYNGKPYYKIPLYVVIGYLVQNGVLPDDNFMVWTGVIV